MGYMHILSLYKCPFFFENFKEVYAMEKIHGTSTWITYIPNEKLKYHSGGEKNNDFKALFNEEFLEKKLDQISLANNWSIIKIHGEGYGGKQQGMCKTYGAKLRFIVFDIFVSSNLSCECKSTNQSCEEKSSKFLDVPDAEKIAIELGLEFVDYHRGPNTPEWIEQQSNLESTQAIRNGMDHGKPREGIVVKPINELYVDNKRMIFKHKNAEFWEIKSARPLGQRLQIMDDAIQITNEWVTAQRFNHVIDRLLQTKDDKTIKKSDMKPILDLMIEDVHRESEGEVVWSIDVEKDIRAATGKMFKNSFPDLGLR